MAIKTGKAFSRREAIGLIGAAGMLAAGCSMESSGSITKTKVVVIGAGLSGLNTALHLRESGLDVVILEASTRVGGRLYTRDDLPNRPEAGGYTLGNGSKHVMSRMAQLGVETVEQSFRSRGWTVNVAGESVPASGWEQSALNNTVGDERGNAPSRLEGWMVHNGLSNPLKDNEAWLKPEFSEFDIPLRPALVEAGFSEEAIRLAEIASNTPNYDDVSLLQMFRKQAQLRYGSSTKALNVKGGSSRLPEAMAAELADAIQFDKQVASVEQDANGVEVVCKDGSIYQADQVVCTIPFSAAKSIDFRPGLPTKIASAISNTHYVQTSLVHMVATHPFWEDDGLPPAMWTDTGIERVYKRLDNPEGRDINNMTVWVTGDTCASFDVMTSAERSAHVINEIKRMRPATEGCLEVVGETLWNKNPLAQGVYHMFKPGQITEFASELTKPVGRLFFAGEHTAVVSAGIEGAMESGERVAKQVIAA